MALKVKFILAWTARNAVRLIVGLALLLTLVGVSLWFVPFSSEYVNRRVRESFTKATGLDLRFDALVFYLAQQRFILRDATIVDPKTKTVLTGAERLETVLTIDWQKKEVRQIRSLSIQQPLMLSFVQTNKGILPSPELRTLLDSRRQDRPSSHTLGIQTISLHDAALELREASTSNTVVARVDHANVIGSWLGKTEYDFMASGSLKALDSEKPTTWRGKISRKPNSPAIAFFTQVAELKGNIKPTEDMPLALVGSRVSASGEFFPPLKDDDSLRSNLNFAADALTITNRVSGRQLHATRLFIRSGITYALNERRLQLDRTVAEALGMQFDGDLNLKLRRPYPYDASVRRLRFPEQSIQRIQAFYPNLRKAVDYHKGDFILSGHLAGSLLEPMPSTLETKTDLRGVELAIGSLPLPLSNLQGSVSFDGQNLVFPHLSGKYGQSEVVLAGSLTSAQPKGLMNQSPDRLKLGWQIVGKGEDLMALVMQGQFASVKGLTTSGSVISSGTLTTQFGNPPTFETGQQNLVVNGTAQLKHFDLDDPRLPAPLRNVSGSMTVRNRSLVLENVRGEFLRSSATLTGSIDGAPYFWNNSKANLAVDTKLNLALVAPEIRSRLKNSDKLPPLKGTASAQFQFQGEIQKPETLRYTGQVKLENVETTLDVPSVHGKISGASGTIRLDREKLALENMRFSIGDVKYIIDGDLRTTEVNTHLRFSGPLKQIQKAQAPLFDEFNVGGDLQFDDTIRLVLPEPEKAKAARDKRFPPIFAFAQGVKSVSARAMDPLDLLDRLIASQKGTWIFRDATFTYENLPQQMEHMNGTVALTKEGFSSDRLNMTIGGYPARVKIAYDFIKDGHHAMDLDITAPDADLTPWYQEWPSTKRPKKPPLTGAPRLKSTIRTVLHMGKTKVRRYQFTRHTGELMYENWNPGSKLLYLNNVEMYGYNGKATVNGKMTFPRGGAPVTWSYLVKTADIELRNFIPAAFGKDSFMSGRLNLDMQIEGQRLDKQTFRGGGTGIIYSPQFQKGNPVVVNFQQLVKFFSLSGMVFPQAQGRFVIRDGYVASDRITMGNEVVEMAARGRVYLNLIIDMELFINPLSVANRIPLLNKPIEKIIGTISSSLLKFRISGPASNVSMTPIPASADRLEDLGRLFSGQGR